ncbi:MAG TPA: tryptophan 7-halogenase [Chthonomonadaceae bacterium]|nr:tryptophan 7-halogenase [Chthonomonadaceae bacterium]
MITDFDLIIVGSGFGGSLLGMVARRLGLSVQLVERGRHPRFAVGESTSPLTNLLLEEIARGYDLPRLLPLTTYGAWQRTYPEIGCGLKRGFTYYKHEAGLHFEKRADRANELLVAASPADEVSDTHWLRADVDHFFLKEAISLGVKYSDETETTLEMVGEAGGIVTLARRGSERRETCRLLIDATGPRGFLHRALGLEEREFVGFPRTRGLFSHFVEVPRTEDLPQFGRSEGAPYRPDDAALHHVFDDGWMWVLRFGNGVTSAGFSVTEELAAELDLSDRERAWSRLLARYPTVGAQFACAQRVQPWLASDRLAFRSGAATGPGWAMLPSAAAFVDPLFSTGIPLTLIGIQRLGELLAEAWGGPHLSGRLRRYADLTLSDADWSAEFVGGCFAAMPHFPAFVDYSMYYFAAASFGEMARRIGRRDLASRFMLQNRPDFAAGLRSGAMSLHAWRARRNAGEAGVLGGNAHGQGHCGPQADAASRTYRATQMGPPATLNADVTAAVRSSNIAGLCDPAKRNWYGIDLQDLIDNAERLGLTPASMRALLAEADWASGGDRQ